MMTRPSLPAVVVTFKYVDANDVPVGLTKRIEPGRNGRSKDFQQYRSDGAGGFTLGLNGSVLPLYRLPEVLDAAERAMCVFFTEGEGKCDALRALIGKRAAVTTIAGGANARLREEHIAAFRGAKRVVVLADSDVPGRDAAATRAKQIAAAHPEIDVRIVDFYRERNDGRDVADWIAEGKAIAELRQLVESAPRILPAPAADGIEERVRAVRSAATFINVGELLDEVDEEVPQLVDGLIGRGSTVLVAAKPKVGKTSFLLNVALNVARGTPFLGRPVCQGPVLYVALEGNRAEWRRVLRAMGAAKGDPLFLFVGQAPQDALRWLREHAEKHKPALIIVDTFQRLTRLKDLNDYAAVTNASEPIVEIAQTLNAALLLAHHAKKNSDGDDGDSVLGSTALYGFVDTLISLKKGAEGRRTLKTSQRYGDDLEETVIVLDPRTKLLSAAGARSDVDRADCEASIISILEKASRWLDRTDLLDELEARKQTKNAALQQVVDDGRVARIGAGRRNVPFLYAIPGTPVFDDDSSAESVSGSEVPALCGEPETANRKPPSHKGLFVPAGVADIDEAGTRNEPLVAVNQGTSGTAGTTNDLAELSADEATF